MKPLLAFLVSLCFLFIPAYRGFCQANKVTDFARDIAPILRENCLSCHEGEKARNGFLVADRDALLGFVEPGNVASSSLWTDYLFQPSKDKKEDSLVMPPDGPLNPSQLALLRLWIEEGAEWPIGLSLETHSLQAVPQNDELKSWSRRLFLAMGYFHPAVVHFPIALFFVGGVLAFLSYFLGPKFQSTAFQCLAIAVFTSVLAVFMGWSFAETKGYPVWNKMLTSNASHDEMNFFFHRWLGVLTLALGVTCVIAGLVSRRNKSNALNHTWRIGTIFLAALAGLVGHQGGELVYGDIFEKAMERLFR